MTQPTPTPPAAYSPGLDGVIAGQTAICHVDPAAGLLYRGYDIHELATQASFERVVYLLIHGEMPDANQYQQFCDDLIAAGELPPPVLAMLRLLPPKAHPIDALRTGVSMLGSFDPTQNEISHAANVRKAVGLVAKVSTITTSHWRISRGKEPVVASPSLGHAARFLFGLDGIDPPEYRVSALNVILNLYAEHDFNASTFAARVTASTLSDMYSAIVAAIGALKGPLHGGANQEAMNMILEIGSPDRAEPWVKDRLSRRQKIMGFGHRVYKKGDSRVPAMRSLAIDLSRRAGDTHLVEICQKLEEVMAREKQLYANLDLYAAPALHELGIEPDLDISIFACARVAGWCAHVIEQQDNNKLIRPRSLYVGAPLRVYHPDGA